MRDGDPVKLDATAELDGFCADACVWEWSATRLVLAPTERCDRLGDV